MVYCYKSSTIIITLVDKVLNNRVYGLVLI